MTLSPRMISIALTVSLLQVAYLERSFASRNSGAPAPPQPVSKTKVHSPDICSKISCPASVETANWQEVSDRDRIVAIHEGINGNGVDHYFYNCRSLDGHTKFSFPSFEKRNRPVVEIFFEYNGVISISGAQSPTLDYAYERTIRADPGVETQYFVSIPLQDRILTIVRFADSVTQTIFTLDPSGATIEHVEVRDYALKTRNVGTILDPAITEFSEQTTAYACDVTTNENLPVKPFAGSTFRFPM